MKVKLATATTNEQSLDVFIICDKCLESINTYNIPKDMYSEAGKKSDLRLIVHEFVYKILIDYYDVFKAGLVVDKSVKHYCKKCISTTPPTSFKDIIEFLK